MFEALHDIYPMLIAAGFATAVVPLAGIKIDSPEKIPRIVRIVTESFILLATFISLVGAILAFWYVGRNVQWLIDSAYSLIMTAFILLLFSFLFTFLIMTVHPFWRALFYSQFEAAQKKDLKEVLAVEKGEDNVAPPDLSSTRNTSASQEKPEP